MQNQQEEDPRAQSEWLSDIAYFESVTSRETQSVAHKLRGRIDPAQDPAAQIESLIEEISRSMGRLGARMQIVETVLANERGDRRPRHKGIDPASLVDHFHQTAEQWEGNPNLLSLEFDAQKRPFRWSGAQRTTRFRLAIDRTQNRGISVVVVALIKQEYLHSLQLLIDGSPVQYQLQYVAGTNHLIATIPQSDKMTMTVLDLVLPATHSPHALGHSEDQRQIGIALSEIILTAKAKNTGRGIGTRLRQLRSRFGL